MGAISPHHDSHLTERTALPAHLSSVTNRPQRVELVDAPWRTASDSIKDFAAVIALVILGQEW